MRGEGQALLLGRRDRTTSAGSEKRQLRLELKRSQQDLTSACANITASATKAQKERVFQNMHQWLQIATQLNNLPEWAEDSINMSAGTLVTCLVNDSGDHVSIDTDREEFTQVCFDLLKLSDRSKRIAPRYEWVLAQQAFNPVYENLNKNLKESLERIIEEVGYDLGMNCTVVQGYSDNAKRHILATDEGQTLCSNATTYGRGLSTYSIDYTPDPLVKKELCKKCEKAYKKALSRGEKVGVWSRYQNKPEWAVSWQQWTSRKELFYDAAEISSSVEEMQERLTKKEADLLVDSLLQRSKECDTTSQVSDEARFRKKLREWYLASDASRAPLAQDLEDMLDHSLRS